jgi:pyridoxine kinase
MSLLPGTSGGESPVSPHALLISSHVVFGVVGNKSSAFPLQLLGFDVDQLNSVQLSNHTGYSSFKGQVLNGDELEKIIAGLSENGLLGSYSAVLSGYVSSATFLRKIAAAVESIRATNKQLSYVCDPVMGDHGKLYVPPELVPIYRQVVAPMATLLTPNQTELELLASPDIDAEGTTGRITPIKEPKDAFKAIDVLHSRGTKAVVVTSSALPLGQEKTMLLLASCPWGKSIII